MHAIPLRHDDVFYPESDGQPMGETEIHRDEIVYLIEALKKRFQATADVYVGGNLFLYLHPGHPQAVICPDVMVVQGVPKLPRRRIYKLWEEGEPPCLVIEVSSQSTQGKDFDSKKALYERLGIEEYFLYDPLKPRLRGFRLEDNRYRPAPPEPDGSLLSHTSGVTLRLEGDQIRVVETATGRPFLRIAEMDAEIETAGQARHALEAEIARLRGELERRTKEERSKRA